MSIVIDQNVTSYQYIFDLIESTTEETEQILIISGISWQNYNKLLESFGDDTSFLFKYSQETLQIMSPSSHHEFYKENLGILLEAYFQQKGIRFYSLGSTTLRSNLTRRGIEPDKSYCLKTRKNIPDLAIEVVVTSGGIDSLEIYQALGVPEVWFWQNDQLRVYCLKEGQYSLVTHSDLLPEFDLMMFASYVAWEEPFDAVMAFREKL